MLINDVSNCNNYRNSFFYYITSKWYLSCQHLSLLNNSINMIRRKKIQKNKISVLIHFI